MGALERFRVAEQRIGENGREVLKGDRAAELLQRAQKLAGELLAAIDHTLHLAQRDTACPAERFIVALVLPAMDRLLCHEATDAPLQLRIIELAAIGFHTVDEELLAQRKEDRHGIEEGRLERIVAMPVGLQHFFHVEMLVARHNLDILRRAGCAGTVHSSSPCGRNGQKPFTALDNDYCAAQEVISGQAGGHKRTAHAN